MRALLVVGLVLGISCKQERPGPVTGGAIVEPMADDRDRLWTFAPEGTTLGVVVSARGVALLEAALFAIQERLASRPELSGLRSELTQVLQSAVGSSNPTLTDLGLSAGSGLALFMTGSDPKVIVLPIGTRDRFVAANRGSKRADGDDVRGWVCRARDSHYVCGRQRELLSRLGRGGLEVVRRTWGIRGDVEVVWRSATADGPRVAVVAELERGGVMVSGTIGGISRQVLDNFASLGKPRGESETAAAFGVIDARPMLALAPPMPIVQGVALKELTRAISGPITYVLRAGTNDMGIRVPLNDPEPAKAIIGRCADLASLIRRPTEFRDGACRIPFPGYDFTLEGWLEGNELKIGDRAAGGSLQLTPSRLARELAHGEWFAAFYGRGSYFNQRHAPQPPQRRPADVMQVLQSLLPLVVEMGVGIRKDGDALQFVGGARSIWSYPDEVAQKLLAISPDSLLSGDAIERCESIATAAPGSVFAQDFRATPTGMMGIGIVFSFVTNVLPDAGPGLAGAGPGQNK
jgi:hypothetical protein